MKESDRIRIARQAVRTAASLTDAIHDAGGHIRLNELLDMTTEEFICKIAANNNIVFKFKKD